MKKAVQQLDVSIPEEERGSEKTRLEREKLQLEIKHLNSRWYIPALIQAGPSTFFVLATVFLAWKTGLLDARRENLSAQNERLQTQRILLQQEEKEIRAQVASLDSELKNVETELDAYKAEEKAIRLVRKLMTGATIEHLIDEVGFRIKIEGPQFVVTEVWDGAKFTRFEDDTPKKITEALQAIATMRNVRFLTIKKVPLAARDLELIGSLASLQLLALTENGLNDDAISHLPAMTELKDLAFFQQSFTNVPALSGCTNLTDLRFHGTPVGGDGLRELQGLRNLERIGLHTTAITDQEIPLLMDYPNLHSLSVEGTAITEKGIRKLASHAPLRKLYVSDNLFNERLEAAVKELNPVLSLIDSKNAYVYGDFF